MITMDNGSLIHIYDTVVYEGVEYPAPLNTFPILVRQTLLELLRERSKSWNELKNS